MTSSVIEEIKNKLDLVEFLRGYLEIKSAGKNFKALCPFHKEKTPSLMISQERQIWHCFGCTAGGDIFAFLMKYENLEFYEALKILAEKAGIELRRVSPAEQREFGVLYDLNQAASDFFIVELSHSAVAKEYLLSRGLKTETIEEFGLGFAPNNFEDLTIYLINKGFDARDIIRSGLAIKNERGKIFDRFRGRIMFPLYNSFGKAIGFSGRILPMFEGEETAKYLNSPETPIFNKSRLIYGLHLAKEAIRGKGEILLVEGQMDVVMCHQDGVKNAVGTSGTALTKDHIEVLKRYARCLILCFDADEAGKQAVERSVDLIHSFDLEVKVLNLAFLTGGKKYKDPAEMVKESAGLLKEVISQAKPAIEYYLDNYLDVEAGAVRKKEGIRFILDKISKLASLIDRHHWLKELADKTGLSERDLLEEMERLFSINRKIEKNELQEAVSRQLSRYELIAERILGILAYQPSIKDKLQEYENYLPEDYRRAYNAIIDNSYPADGKLAEFLDLVSLRFSLETKKDEELIVELEDLLKNLEIEYLNAEKEKLSDLIKQTGSAEEECFKYIEKFQEVVKKIESLKKQYDRKK